MIDIGKISVIIPAYNAGAYLHDCVESIRTQSYGNLEIIIVDDGSTDDTPNVIDSLKNSDSRIKAVSLENGGVSNARNRGIDAAEGRYITFADADDSIEPGMYELLAGAIEKYHADIAHCGYNRVENGTVKPVNGTGKIYVQNKTDALACLLSGRLFVGSLCNKLYRAELFGGVRLDTQLKINEDVLANYELFLKAEQTVFIDEAKYNYISRKETSSCAHTNRVKKAEDCAAAAKKMLALSGFDPQLRQLALKRYANMLLQVLKTYVLTKEKDKKKQKELQRLIKKYSGEAAYSGKQGMEIRLMRTFPPLYRLIYKIHDKIRVPNWDV